MQEIELFVVVDSVGDFAIAKDRDGLQEAWDNDIGGDLCGSRVIRIVLNVEPQKTVELTADVPAPAANNVTMKISS